MPIIGQACIFLVHFFSFEQFHAYDFGNYKFLNTSIPAKAFKSRVPDSSLLAAYQ